MAQRPILIAGVPRSGTTWVGRVLASAPAVDYRFEPDNEEICPYALQLKQRLPRFPYLRRDADEPRFDELWRAAFDGGVPGRKLELRVRKFAKVDRALIDANIAFRSAADASGSAPPPFPLGPRLRLGVGAALGRHVLYSGTRKPDVRRIVKSVHSVLALDWLRERFSPRVVLIVRHPFNIVASYLRMQMKDGDRGIFAQPHYVADGHFDPALAARAQADRRPVARIAYQLAAMTATMRRYAAADPDCLVVSHDLLCLDASAEYIDLFERLGLAWTPASAQLLDDLNRPGVRYEPRRVRSEEIDKWQQALTPEQVEIIGACFEEFGVPLETHA